MPNISTLWQVAKDGCKKLDIYGILRKNRSITPAELTTFNELKSLVEVNRGGATAEVIRKVKDSVLIAQEILSSSGVSISSAINQCSFLNYVRNLNF